MTYRLTPYGKTRQPLPGVQWRDLSDEEYAEAVALHPGMEEQGYFVQVVEEEAKKEAPRRTKPGTSPAEET